MKTRTLIPAPAWSLLLAAAVFGSTTVQGEELFLFNFNEGSGGNIANTTASLNGTLGTVPVDPVNDTVALETDSPSALPGDGSFSNLGNGFLMANDTTRVLEITNGPITMEAWVKINGSFGKPTEGIVAYGNSYKMGLKGGRQVFTLFGFADITNVLGGAIAPDQWVHLAAVWTPGTGVDFYVDGNHNFVANTNTRARAIQHTYLSLGSENVNNTLVGSFDRIRIHNAVVAAGDLDTNSASPKATFASTIVSYDFNQTSFPATNSLSPQLPADTAVDVLPLITGRPLWVSGVTGTGGDTALAFFATNRATVPDPTPLIVTNNANGNYTIETWAKLPLDYAPAVRAIMFQYTGIPGFSFSINTDRTLHTTAFGKNDRASTAQVPNDGAWHHLAVVHRDGVAFDFYIDGVLKQTVAHPNGVGVNQTLKVLTLGGTPAGANPFTGTLDRIRFSNEALTPGQFNFPAVLGTPFFTTTPADQTVVITSNVTFSATAFGDEPLAYQWQFSVTGVPGTETYLAGELGTTLNLTGVQVADDGYYSLIASNAQGMVTSAVARLIVSTAPVLSTNPTNVTTVVGTSTQFSVTALPAPGYEAVSYQWRYAGTANATPKSDISGATGPTLALNNLQLTNQGFYSVVVSNSGGTTESADAKLTITAPGTLSPLWTILPGERPYITPYNATANLRDLERGMAYNPTTDHLLVGARWTSPNVKGIYILDADTGAHVGELNSVSNIITGGTIVLTRVVVAEDGAIYACNFGTLSDASPLKIYRWASEAAEPTLAYSGNPVSGTGIANQQWGKNMTVRGSGTNTQILMDNRNFLAVFSTTDGAAFTPTLLQPSGLADDWGLGLTWGTNGTSFWGKLGSRPLYQWAYTNGATNAAVLRTYSGFPSSTFGNFSFNEDYRYMAGLTVQTGPDAVELYDVADLDRGPMLVDIALFTPDNTQTVGYGNVFISRDRLFALNPNNGLAAFSFAPRLSIRSEAGNVVISWPTTLVEYGDYVLKATDSPALTGGTTIAHTVQGNVYQATVPASATQKFYYLIKE
jgi:hypothetical protein